MNIMKKLISSIAATIVIIAASNSAHAFGVLEGSSTVGSWKYCYYSDGSVTKVKSYFGCSYTN